MPRPLTQRPSGAVLICVLVCMGIASAIILASVRSSLRARRQMRREIQLEQTRWLLEAGAVRAVQELRADEDYSGETWRVDEAVERFDQARVEITVRRDVAPAGSARVDVVARVAQDAPNAQPTRRSRSLLVELDSPPD